MSTPTNSITLAPRADSLTLSNGLSALQDTLFRAAEENINSALGEQADQYSALSKRAMVVTEALRLTTGMDLSTIIMRGQLILQIEREGLVGVHPNGYTNLTELAKDNNVSVGELSDIRALVEHIFPYIENVLQLNLHEVWGSIGKSSFREMVPALRSLITGEQADHASVRTAVRNMLDTAAATLLQNNEDMTPETLSTPEGDAIVRQAAVENLLHDGSVMTTRDMRRRVRPSRVEAIEMATMQTADGEWYAVMKLNSTEKKDLALRIMNPHTNNMMLDGRGEGTTNVRRLLSSFFGAH
jgi:hypothetical protein